MIAAGFGASPGAVAIPGARYIRHANKQRPQHRHTWSSTKKMKGKSVSMERAQDCLQHTLRDASSACCPPPPTATMRHREVRLAASSTREIVPLSLDDFGQAISSLRSRSGNQHCTHHSGPPAFRSATTQSCQTVIGQTVLCKTLLGKTGT